ncbi:acetate/propionate family kinase [Thalassolituus marinus]|uniref:Acetate kinase n=1 Tax=Thalassolituus marinus TaxID=671053 RepID=A0ABS7ZQG4_9GAMM|nr:acetate kinase [Thalassolituus marinus]MCA6063944.1 acetate kinase [Thalassolituus marinus]
MSKSLLVINCGSSSIKFALYDANDLTTPKLTALAERLGEESPVLIVKGVGAGDLSLDNGADHQHALSAFIEYTREHISDLAGIGHRVVHGGELFHQSTIIDDSNFAQLETLNPLAPLHNPINLLGIRLCADMFPGVPQVAVFDTAFHQSLAESTYLYGVPYAWYEENGVRRYGFHGTSYRYISTEVSRRLQQPAEDLNLLIAHLGNGCSACAVRAGQSVDTTMGLTPLEGLVMGSRCGDIDPGLVEHIEQARGMDTHEVLRDLNRRSGLLGLSGLSNDMRTLLAAEAEGHEGARRAIDVFCFRVARHFAALSVSLRNIDAVVFTGGIGEHAAAVRQRILAHWRNMDFRLDDDLNNSNGDDQGRISQSGSPLVLVVPTDEEGMIAQDTLTLINHS